MCMYVCAYMCVACMCMCVYICVCVCVCVPRERDRMSVCASLIKGVNRLHTCMQYVLSLHITITKSEVHISHTRQPEVAAKHTYILSTLLLLFLLALRGYSMKKMAILRRLKQLVKDIVQQSTDWSISSVGRASC